jgi:hypothetical protein
VALLRADSARLRAAGAARAARIGGGGSGSGGAGALAAVPGAAAALLDAAFRDNDANEEEEIKASAAALKAAVAWARSAEGARALREAGAVGRAEAAMKRGKGEENEGSKALSVEAAEDARHLCWLLVQQRQQEKEK